MDWAKAIETNQAALARIVATLIAMLGLASEAAAARLPQPLYRAVLRVLRPAESAVRRLIVVAAQGLKAEFAPPRPMSKGPSRSRGAGGSRISSFQLFDPPEREGRARPRRAAARGPEPRIHFFDVSPLTPLFQPRPAASPVPEPDDGRVSATRLCRRLAAVKLALETLPRQAKRLARLRARLAGMPSPKSRSPLRSGCPPGHRKEPKDEIDWVLKECHALATTALTHDTS